MGMTDTSPHMLLGPGPLSHAVSAAMHAVPSGNVYWGDAVAQQLPAASGMSPHPDSHQHEAAMQQHLAGVQPFSLPLHRILLIPHNEPSTVLCCLHHTWPVYCQHRLQMTNESTWCFQAVESSQNIGMADPQACSMAHQHGARAWCICRSCKAVTSDWHSNRRSSFMLLWSVQHSLSVADCDCTKSTAAIVLGYLHLLLFKVP